jgi:hypothetical protein
MEHRDKVDLLNVGAVMARERARVVTDMER